MNQAALSEFVKPKCHHYQQCSGCSMQHIVPANQIAMKQRMLLAQLQQVGLAPVEMMPALQQDSWHYRHKARLSVKFVAKKDKVLVGFRERHPRYIADLDSCSILAASVSTLLTQLKQLFAQLQAYKNIAQVEVASGAEGVALVIRHLKPLIPEDQTQLIQFAQTHKIHLYLQSGGLKTVKRVWPIEGIERLSYQFSDLGLKFLFHPMDFTQVNPHINKQMVLQALNWLNIEKTDNVLDLFCGLGNFTLPLAQQAYFVQGVEGSEAMVQRGYENATLNNIENIAFDMTDLSDAEQVMTAPWAQVSYDKVVLDPPRSGAARVLPWIGLRAPKAILYVSCQADSFVRDAESLVKEYGYRLQRLGIMDMFPHTLHAETMALFVHDSAMT